MQQPDLVTKLQSFFAADPHGALFVYLFGSEARGQARPSSDVDVGVFFEKDPEPTFSGLPLDLEAELESLLGRPAQVVSLNTAPADLVHRVLRDGVLILDRDRSRRIRYEVARRNEYFDLLPMLQEYRRGPRARDATK